MDSESPSSVQGFSVISSSGKHTRKRKAEGKDNNVRKTRKKKHKTYSVEKRKEVGDDTESNPEHDTEEVTDEFVSPIFGQSNLLC